MIERVLISKIRRSLAHYPALAILGPRQVGKTTLVKMLQAQLEQPAVYLDLESDEDLLKIQYASQYFKERSDHLIIIDEIQRKPELLISLRSLIDENRRPGRFILLGSASPELLAQSSETLAGRIAYLEMHPFVFPEIRSSYDFNRLWLKGGYPEFFLQDDLEVSLEMRVQFIQTYLEREFSIIGLSASPIVLRNLLRMLAHSNAQIINYTGLSKSLGVEVNTVKRYIDFFENAFLIRRLHTYSLNTRKRIVKSPKVFIRDSGLLHALYSIENKEGLDGFAGKGGSWEGFVIQQIIAMLKPDVQPYYYRTQDGSELDLVLVKGLKPVLGIEIKLSNSPGLSRGTTIASTDLGNIPVLLVTHSAPEDFSLSDKIRLTNFENGFPYLQNQGLI